ncbi:helix-turn-helix domain-containing protein [Mahella australiensis]|uniref:Helix-turn-helix domain protein n=1 Tax=Mahella australiensis (strain DSM 15567 / CIP 107919 / 50-1 BON) TaxID=697281 RepID=F4A0X7_MAHA5|nr:helix-turn-helix domain-containing protein [Mahella australiensis]AEE98054.1 helix-turn-helix domain protein [Mahella australiensis 50-1 BON]
MNRIKELREEAKISQAELASILGVTQQALSNYENGLREPDLDTINKIANYFGVSIDYLLCRTNVRNSDVIEEAIKDDPELERIWNMLNNREEVRLMFKKIADLKPADVKRILKIIEIVEEEDSASQL